MSNKSTYKFRAECAHDVKELSKALLKDKVAATINSDQDGLFPDCEVTIDTECTIEEIRTVMRSVVDGHTMVQTLQSESEYDGIRNYDL